MKVTQLSIIKFLIIIINSILNLVLRVKNIFKSDKFVSVIKVHLNELLKYIKLIYSSSKFKEINGYLKYSNKVKPDVVFNSNDNNSTVIVNEVFENYLDKTSKVNYLLKFINIKNNITTSRYVSLNNPITNIVVTDNNYFWLQDHTTLKLYRLRKDHKGIIEIELNLREVRDITLDDIILNPDEVIDIRLKVNNVIIHDDNNYTIVYDDGFEFQIVNG